MVLKFEFSDLFSSIKQQGANQKFCKQKELLLKNTEIAKGN